MRINFLLFFLTSITLYSQDKIKVLTDSNKSSTFIETYNYLSYSNEYSLKEAIRIGPSSLKVLKKGVDTAIKWVKLNNQHNKTFSKEISRFKATDKETYDFYKKYIDQFADEYIITFYGDYNGDFKLIIKSRYDDFILIDNFETLLDFNKILSGESANDEIDDIFKN